MGFLPPHAMLALLSSRGGVWPPAFPRPGTLLTPSSDPQTPRGEWGATEWRAYAEFLETEGRKLLERLREVERQRDTAQGKLRRRKRTTASAVSAGANVTLLGGYGQPAKKKRGRKPAEKTNQAVEAVLSICAAFKQNGKRITQKDALALYYRQIGLREGRVNEAEGKNILRAISRHKKRNNSKTSGQ